MMLRLQVLPVRCTLSTAGVMGKQRRSALPHTGTSVPPAGKPTTDPAPESTHTHTYSLTPITAVRTTVNASLALYYNEL